MYITHVHHHHFVGHLGHHAQVVRDDLDGHAKLFLQLSLIAQGSSPQAFEHWLPTFNTVMRTVKFGDWWSEVTGVEWLRRAYKTPRERHSSKRAGTPPS